MTSCTYEAGPKEKLKRFFTDENKISTSVSSEFFSIKSLGHCQISLRIQLNYSQDCIKLKQRQQKN